MYILVNMYWVWCGIFVWYVILCLDIDIMVWYIVINVIYLCDVIYLCGVMLCFDMSWYIVYIEMVMCLGLCGVCIFVGYDIVLCGSELVFIPGWVGVESSWVGVEFTLKVVRLEDGIFPTTTPPPSRRNRRFRNADMPWWNIRPVDVVLTSTAVRHMLHEHRRTRKPASKQCRRRLLRASAYHTY